MTKLTHLSIGILAIILASSATACMKTQAIAELKTPEAFTWSEKPVIKARHLAPNESYILKVERPSKWNADRTLVSENEYVSDSKGRFTTAQSQMPDSGDLSVYLPFQSMKSVEARSDVEDGNVLLTLTKLTGEVIVEKTVPFGANASTMSERPLGEDFTGAFILKSKQQSGKSPALVILGGSEGGDGSARSQAPEFVDQGFIVLGLPYYSPAWFNDAAFPELPSGFDNLPIDYLESAVKALRSEDDVDENSISLLGGSKGAEFVLLAGSLIPDTSEGGGFCAIIADVPSDVVWEGWGRPGAEDAFSGFSWRGKPLPFVPYVDMGKALSARQTGADYTMTEAHEQGRINFPERAEAARISVEAIDEPVLLIGGDKDTTWASGKSSRIIYQARKKAELETEIYAYTEATHAVGGNPLNPTNLANLKARVENYPAMMDFLQRHSKRTDCRD